MATAVPSRFAVLSIEDDDYKPKKTQKSTTVNKTNTKSKGDKPKQQQQQTNKKKQNKVSPSINAFCFRLNTSRMWFVAGNWNALNCFSRWTNMFLFYFLFTLSFQGKKKKTSNDDQQWEQWKQKDTMVKCENILNYIWNLFSNSYMRDFIIKIIYKMCV